VLSFFPQGGDVFSFLPAAGDAPPATNFSFSAESLGGMPMPLSTKGFPFLLDTSVTDLAAPRSQRLCRQLFPVPRPFKQGTFISRSSLLLDPVALSGPFPAFPLDLSWALSPESLTVLPSMLFAIDPHRPYGSLLLSPLSFRLQTPDRWLSLALQRKKNSWCGPFPPGSLFFLPGSRCSGDFQFFIELTPDGSVGASCRF